MEEMLSFVKEKIKNGEDECTEFKKASVSFPNDGLETISAFANTNGGWLILGVEEDKNNKFSVLGVENPKNIIDQLFTLMNNTHKISRNVISNESISTLKLENSDGEEKTIVVIRVEKENYKNKPIYLKNNPKLSYVRMGTTDIQAQDDIINHMIRDASEESVDSSKLLEFTMNDLDSNTISKYRSHFNSIHEEHPFNQLDDESFLHRINALSVNRKKGTLVPTIAGLLVFGKHSSIKEVLPHYNVEYINKSKTNQNSSFIDRVIYDGTWGEDNVYNFFFEVINKIYLTINENSMIGRDSITRLSPSKLKIALREALINSIIHCDFKIVSSGILIIRYSDRIIFKNGGSLRISKEDFFMGGISNPRNYFIQEIFRMVNLCEKAGTGIPKIMDAVKTYNYKYPEISTNLDSFEMIIWDTSIIENYGIENEIEKEIIKLAVAKNIITIELVAEQLDVHRNTASKYLNNLVERFILDKVKMGKSNYYTISQTEGFEKYDLVDKIYTLLEEMKRKK